VASADAQQIVLRRKDANALFNGTTTDRIENLCHRLGLAFSYKDAYIEERNRLAEAQGQPTQSLGSTEMGRITAASNGLVHGTTLQIPTTGYHTMEESAAVDTCEGYLKLLMGIARLAG
jgi:hypothetical protein